MVDELAPSRRGDPEFRRWMSRRMRFGASPSEASALSRMRMRIDVRSALSSHHVPTLVTYTPHSKASSVEDARYLAAHIPGAILREVQSPDHHFWTTQEGTDQVVGTMRKFIEGIGAAAGPDRILTTVLLTDIVGSTERASKLGDHQWTEVLERHHAALRQQVARHRGTLVKTTSDGSLSASDGPTRAIRCALAVARRAEVDGLAVRAGLHTGECLLRAGDIHGIAVHIASRIADIAGPGGVLVSSTVRDLSVGSDMVFEPRGAQSLRGVEGEWRLYAAGGERRAGAAASP